MEASRSSETEPGRFWWPVLAAILLAAAALRFYGIGWGLPNQLHDYSYHPDEFLTLGAAYGSIYARGSFNPRFYNYPSLYLYLSALAIAVALAWGVSATLGGIYLVARIVTVLMGVGAVAATWWAGRTLFGETAGLLAALFICVAPLHVQHSHFATVDVPSTLFVALALGYAGLVLKRGSWRDYVLGGIAVGLAAGTKYNAGLVLLAVVAAHLLRGGAWKALLGGRMWASVGCAIAAFVASTPGVVLAPQEFWYGFSYELMHAAEGHGLVFAGTGNGFWYTLSSSLSFGLTPLLLAVSVLGVVWGLVRRDRRAIVILAFVVPYYVLISLSQVRFARYTLPMFPAMAILAGWLITTWWEGARGRRALSTAVAAVCLAAVFLELICSLLLVRYFSTTPPQDAAAQWVFSHAKRGDSIGFIDTPWFYSPPLTRDFGWGSLDQRREAALKAPYNIVVFSDFNHPGDWYTQQTPPKWVVVSDYEVADALRLRRDRELPAEQKQEVRQIVDDLELVRRHYRRRVTYGGYLEMLDMGAFPHDMRYASPSITIYELKR